MVTQLDNKEVSQKPKTFLLVLLVVYLCERGSAFWEGSARISGGWGVVGLTLSPSVPLTSSGAGGDWRSPGADSYSGTTAAAAANTAALWQRKAETSSKFFRWEVKKRQMGVPAVCSLDVKPGLEHF